MVHVCAQNIQEKSDKSTYPIAMRQQRPAARQTPRAQFKPYLLQPPCTTMLHNTLHPMTRPLPGATSEHLL